MTSIALAGALAVANGGDPVQGQTGDGSQIHVGLGWGTRHCDECGGRFSGIAGNVIIGSRVDPHLLLGGMIGGWTGHVRVEDDSGGSTEGAQLAAIVAPIGRIYPSAAGAAFVLAGVGFGLSTRGLGRGETGTAFVAGAGYDHVGDGDLCVTPFVNAMEIAGVADGTTIFQIGLGVTTR